MELKKGTTYISDRSCLEVYIMDMYEVTQSYVKARIMITHKKYGFYYGTEIADLYYDRIQHWNPVKETE